MPVLRGGPQDHPHTCGFAALFLGPVAQRNAIAEQPKRAQQQEQRLGSTTAPPRPPRVLGAAMPGCALVLAGRVAARLAVALAVGLGNAVARRRAGHRFVGPGRRVGSVGPRCDAGGGAGKRAGIAPISRPRHARAATGPGGEGR